MCGFVAFVCVFLFVFVGNDFSVFQIGKCFLRWCWLYFKVYVLFMCLVALNLMLSSLVRCIRGVSFCVRRWLSFFMDACYLCSLLRSFVAMVLVGSTMLFRVFVGR